MEKELARHSFTFNPEDNGDESLTLTTIFYDNGDMAAGLSGDPFTNQEISLRSCCNSAAIRLFGTAITPGALRQLANELEDVRGRCRSQFSIKSTT